MIVLLLESEKDCSAANPGNLELEGSLDDPQTSVHDIRNLVLREDLFGFIVLQSELGPEHEGATILPAEVDDLLCHLRQLFAGTEHVDNLDLACQFRGQVYEAGIGFLADDLVRRRIHGYDLVAVVLHELRDRVGVLGRVLTSTYDRDGLVFS